MGATHSSPFFNSSAATASCESNDGGGPSYETDEKIPAADSSSVPPAPMPTLARPETFEEKLYRKVSEKCWYVLTWHCFGMEIDHEYAVMQFSDMKHIFFFEKQHHHWIAYLTNNNLYNKHNTVQIRTISPDRLSNNRLLPRLGNQIIL